MNAISTDPRRWTDLAEENARLRAALEVAQETISALSRCIGREDFEAEKRAMANVDDWNKLRRLLPDPQARRAAA